MSIWQNDSIKFSRRAYDLAYHIFFTQTIISILWSKFIPNQKVADYPYNIPSIIVPMGLPCWVNHHCILKGLDRIKWLNNFHLWYHQ